MDKIDISNINLIADGFITGIKGNNILQREGIPSLQNKLSSKRTFLYIRAGEEFIQFIENGVLLHKHNIENLAQQAIQLFSH